MICLKSLGKQLKKVIKETNNNNKITLTIALSYSSRWEITNSIKKICNDIVRSKIKLKKITVDMVNNYLCTNNLPYPDLLIRTGGEKELVIFFYGNWLTLNYILPKPIGLILIKEIFIMLFLNIKKENEDLEK